MNLVQLDSAFAVRMQNLGLRRNFEPMMELAGATRVPSFFAMELVVF
jgi:hypothetical protein